MNAGPAITCIHAALWSEAGGVDSEAGSAQSEGWGSFQPGVLISGKEALHSCLTCFAAVRCFPPFQNSGPGNSFHCLGHFKNVYEDGEVL